VNSRSPGNNHRNQEREHSKASLIALPVGRRRRQNASRTLEKQGGNVQEKCQNHQILEEIYFKYQYTITD
jgi:hypothetical protein